MASTADERVLRAHFQPLVTEAEALFDRMAQAFETRSYTDLTSQEIDEFDDAQTSLPSLTYAQEFFLGRLKKLAKKTVHGAVNLAKKGVRVISAVGLGAILRQLKTLVVKPLLEKVLKAAIGKLPATLQPYAQTLANKFGLTLGRKAESRRLRHCRMSRPWMPSPQVTLPARPAILQRFKRN